MQIRIGVAVLLGVLAFNSVVSAAPENDTAPGKAEDRITEISFRQGCLCGPDGFIGITLKESDPSTAGFFFGIARWIETQHFFDLKDRYTNEHGGVTECSRAYSVTRGDKKKIISTDCSDPAELWGLRMVMLRVADEMKEQRLRQYKEKQGVRGILENYKPPVVPPAQYVPPLTIHFIPEPYQPGVDAGKAIMGENGTFLVQLLPGSYRTVVEFPDHTKTSQQLVTIEPDKFLPLTVDATKPVIEKSAEPE